MIRQPGAVRTETRLLIGALIGLIAVAVFTTLAAPSSPGTPLSIHSAERDGAMALRQWLEQTGYSVRELVASPIQPSPVQVLFILDPITEYTDKEASAIQDWVRRGNTLILTGSPYLLRSLLDRFSVSMTYLAEPQDTDMLAAPTLINPPIPDKLHVEPFYRIDSDRDDLAVHLLNDGDPVLVSFAEGEGTIWIAGMTYPFTNQALHDPNNARLILNFLSRVPQGAAIGFDEAHHGQSEAGQSLFGWLVGSAPGWGILLAIVLTMVFLALQGRRFGRAVPLPSDRLRREPVEYIQAMANLFRRSGQRTAISKHYRDQLRRRLTERYALDPHLDDIEMIKTIAFRDPSVDEAALRGLLRRLSSNRISEQALINAALDVDAWLKRLA